MREAWSGQEAPLTRSPVEPDGLLLRSNTLTPRCSLSLVPFLHCWLYPSSASLSLFPLLPWSFYHSNPSCLLSVTFLSCPLSCCLTLVLPTLQNTYTAIHSPSHTLQGEVFNWYITSLGYFSRLMENTQNALAFHHSTGKRETLSPHIASVRGSFYQQAAAASSFYRTVSTFQVYFLFLFCGPFTYCVFADHHQRWIHIDYIVAYIATIQITYMHTTSQDQSKNTRGRVVI